MNRDWSGNASSVFKIIGASNHSESNRGENDYYATDPLALDLLLDDGKAKINKDVWEIACGEGHLSERLKMYGYNVRSSDLINRGYGETGVDFLKCSELWHGDILTNPPYKYAQEFVEHALELINTGNKVYMLLRLQFLESKSRRRLFDKSPPRVVYIFSERITCAKNGNFRKYKDGSAMAYAWYEFEKGYIGKTIIKWIN